MSCTLSIKVMSTFKCGHHTCEAYSSTGLTYIPVQNICETSARVCFACMMSTFKSGHHFNRESAAHVYKTYTMSATYNMARGEGQK